MLTGSIALTFYKQPRFTRSVDLVIELVRADAKRFVELFTNDFECDQEGAEEAIRYQKMFDLIHYETIDKFDFVIRKSTEYRVEEFSRRKLLPRGRGEVWVVAPEDLLLSKLLWGKDSESEVQRHDVQSLVNSSAVIDWKYVEHWAEKLDVLTLLKAVRP